MENLLTFLQEHLDYLLLSLIILTGIFITKYTKEITAIKNVYKVLIASIVISVILYFIEECDKDCLPKYLFTYFFATSFYELFVKLAISKIGSFIENLTKK